MRVAIESVNGPIHPVVSILNRDGWESEINGNIAVSTHPQVVDQESARVRLDSLGFLTSAAVRIQIDTF